MTLPATRPIFDFSKWTNLEDLLTSQFAVVRTLKDPLLPGGALASWYRALTGTLSYPTGEEPCAQVLSAATAGQSAALRAYNTVTSADWTLVPDTLGAIAITLEGFKLTTVGGNFTVEFGFHGSSSTIGGCFYYQNNAANSVGEIHTYDASNNLSITPRTITDAEVDLGALNVLKSATASFVAGDVGAPITELLTDAVPYVISGTVITSVDSASQVHLSIPVTGPFTGGTFKIGQVVNHTLMTADHMNMTLLWCPTGKMAWVMADDQVVAEVDLSRVAHYASNVNVEGFQVAVFAGDNNAYGFQWRQAKMYIAHD